MPSIGLALLLVLVASPAMANVAGGNGDRANVTLNHHGEEYTLANGNVTATILGPEGSVVSLKYHGTNLIASSGKHDQIYWSMDGGKSYQNPGGMKCTVKADTTDMADVGCKETYNGSQPHAFDIEIHYCLRRGMTGLYVYALLSHPASYPATSVGEWRVVWQTPDQGGKWLFEKIYVDKTRHWVYPTKDELDHAIATPIKEITIMRSGPWQNRGESKYTYAANYEDIGTFGFASDVHQLGAWTVMGAFEYYNDGPRKQDLTALDGGMTHHFGRNHFGDTGIAVAAGEQWSKVFGPFLLYANGGAEGDALWHDAQAQSAAEQAAWPYAWLTGVAEYPSEAERGSAAGTFAISDAFKPAARVSGAWIGLTQPPPGADFQSETKNYQYWSRVAADGSFTIPHVRPGTYALYAFADGEVGQYLQENVAVSADQQTSLGKVTWTIPRPAGGHLAWELGTPDRDTLEFKHGDDYFQPYLYKTFALEMPNPLVYTIGKSSPAKDWNYMQSAYIKPGQPAVPWLWQVKFDLQSVPKSGEATLILAMAGSNKGRLQVGVNGGVPLDTFSPPLNDGNSLLRQSSHGKYSVKRIAIPMGKLRVGSNSIDLTQMGLADADYVAYDYLALEMPQ